MEALFVSMLQNRLVSFYPERLDIVKQAEQLAATLGGRLEVPPRLSWKYAWIQKGFGWPLAKRAQISRRQRNWSLIRPRDKAPSRFDSRPLAI
jgi:hypothetical protein